MVQLRTDIISYTLKLVRALAGVRWLTDTTSELRLTLPSDVGLLVPTAADMDWRLDGC